MRNFLSTIGFSLSPAINLYSQRLEHLPWALKGNWGKEWGIDRESEQYPGSLGFTLRARLLLVMKEKNETRMEMRGPRRETRKLVMYMAGVQIICSFFYQ